MVHSSVCVFFIFYDFSLQTKELSLSEIQGLLINFPWRKNEGLIYNDLFFISQL